MLARYNSQYIFKYMRGDDQWVQTACVLGRMYRFNVSRFSDVVRKGSNDLAVGFLRHSATTRGAGNDLGPGRSVCLSLVELYTSWPSSSLSKSTPNAIQMRFWSIFVLLAPPAFSFLGRGRRRLLVFTRGVALAEVSCCRSATSWGERKLIGILRRQVYFHTT